VNQANTAYQKKRRSEDEVYRKKVNAACNARNKKNRAEKKRLAEQGLFF
jgi:hypothetical protein